MVAAVIFGFIVVKLVLMFIKDEGMNEFTKNTLFLVLTAGLVVFIHRGNNLPPTATTFLLKAGVVANLMALGLDAIKLIKKMVHPGEDGRLIAIVTFGWQGVFIELTQLILFSWIINLTP